MADFVALIASNVSRVATYYRMFSTDVTWTGAIEIAPRDIAVLQNMTFASLVRAMRDQLRSGRKRLLVVMHATTDHLPYPTGGGAQISPTRDVLDALASAAAGNANGRKTLDSYQDANNKPAFKDPHALDDLIAMLDEVRHNRIDHLEIRGCNIGQSPTFLRSLHECLNSRYTVAPMVKMLAGSVQCPPRNTAAQLQANINRLGPSRRVFSRTECLMPFDSSANPFDPALAMSWSAADAGAHTFSGRIYALSPDAVRGWSQAKFDTTLSWVFGRSPPGGGYPGHGSLPVFGFWTPNGALPFLFPTDLAYCSQLTVVT